MSTSPIVGQRAAELHQRERRAAAERSRLQQAGGHSPGGRSRFHTRKGNADACQDAAQLLVEALPVSARIAHQVTVTIARIAGAVFDGDVVLAGFSPYPG